MAEPTGRATATSETCSYLILDLPSSPTMKHAPGRHRPVPLSLPRWLSFAEASDPKPAPFFAPVMTHWPAEVEHTR